MKLFARSYNIRRDTIYNAMKYILLDSIFIFLFSISSYIFIDYINIKTKTTPNCVAHDLHLSETKRERERDGTCVCTIYDTRPIYKIR